MPYVFLVPNTTKLPITSKTSVAKNLLILHILFVIKFDISMLIFSECCAILASAEPFLGENVEISFEVITKLLAAGVSTSRNCYPCSYEVPASYSDGHYQPPFTIDFNLGPYNCVFFAISDCVVL